MRLSRTRLRSLMVAIVFLALVITVIKQTFLLQQAAVREELLRAQVDSVHSADSAFFSSSVAPGAGGQRPGPSISGTDLGRGKTTAR